MQKQDELLFIIRQFEKHKLNAEKRGGGEATTPKPLIHQSAET